MGTRRESEELFFNELRRSVPFLPVPAYVRLGQLFTVLSDWEIAPFEERAADQFAGLRRQRIRIGTIDLKIASIALVIDALLVTANLRDFSLVPGLRCENWLQQ
jgi:tRNA(fMet)-specific endonuclease VapC